MDDDLPAESGGLEEELVDRVDEESEREDMNRSRAIESILEEYFRSRSIRTAVVLCGDPEARTLHDYKGKPVLEHILDHLSGEGFTRTILLVGNNTEIEQRFGEFYDSMKLDYVEEDSPGGTALALRKVDVEDSFAVLNGHVITDVDIEEMCSVHRSSDSIATIALTTVEDPSRYGVAKMKGSRILGFEEKPEPGEEPSRLINAGTYIVEPEIFDHLDHNSLEEVFKDLADQRRLSGYIYGGEWVDIDRE